MSVPVFQMSRNQPVTTLQVILQQRGHLSKYLLSLATSEHEIKWQSVSEIAASSNFSPYDIRSRLSAMNRSLLGYEIVVGEGEQKYDFSELETFRIYKYKS